MKLPGGMEIHMTIQAGDAQAGLGGFPIGREIEFLLWKLSDQHSQAIQLNWSDQASK